MKSNNTDNYNSYSRSKTNSSGTVTISQEASYKTTNTDANATYLYHSTTITNNVNGNSISHWGDSTRNTTYNINMHDRNTEVKAYGYTYGVSRFTSLGNLGGGIPTNGVWHGTSRIIFGSNDSLKRSKTTKVAYVGNTEPILNIEHTSYAEANTWEHMIGRSNDILIVPNSTTPVEHTSEIFVL